MNRSKEKTIELEDSNDYYLIEEDMPRAQPGHPHCDCQEASEAAGVLFPHGFSASSRVIHMKPVTPTVNDTCPYCDHHVFYRSPDGTNKNVKSMNKRNKAPRIAKAALLDIWDRPMKPRLSKSLELPNSNELIVLPRGNQGA